MVWLVENFQPWKTVYQCRVQIGIRKWPWGADKHSQVVHRRHFSSKTVEFIK